jgi:hypothetical protein
MKSVILFLAILSVSTSFMLSTAAKQAVDGPNWASDLCRAGRSLSLCQNSLPLAYAGVGLAALWIFMMFVSAIRD